MAQFSLIDNQLQTFVIKGRLPQWVAWPLVLLFGLGVVLGVEQYLHYYTLTEVVPETTIVDNFGVVRQSTDFTCVPAAMTTLLIHQGDQVGQRDVTSRLGTTVFGTYPWRIAPAGRHFGYQVQKDRMTFQEILAAEDPMLIYNKFEEGLHVSYIPPGRLSKRLTETILEGRPGELLPVMDPTDGLILLDESGFAQYFDGAGEKVIYRFNPKIGEARSVDVEGMILEGNIPKLISGAMNE